MNKVILKNIFTILLNSPVFNGTTQFANLLEEGWRETENKEIVKW